jgi:hypothetical protein
VAAQRGHSIPEAPHTTAAGHRGMARLPRKQNRTPALRGPQHARIRTHASLATSSVQASDARWSRAKKNRARSYTLGTQGVGGSAGGHRPFGGAPPPPQPRRRESGGEARPYMSASLTAFSAAKRFLHGIFA